MENYMSGRPGNFVNDQHAFYAGVVLGMFQRMGNKPVPELDDEGNYTPNFTVEFGGQLLRLSSPEPPEGWVP
jgi:hypothetical protein